jgi:hypothetical protein
MQRGGLRAMAEGEFDGALRVRERVQWAIGTGRRLWWV